MPKLTLKELTSRIRDLAMDESMWIKVMHPNFENGGLIDLHYCFRHHYRVTVWDAYQDRQRWVPHNKRSQLYLGYLEGALLIIRQHRRGRVTI